MVKPSFQPIHDGSRVGPVGQSDVVAFEGFNKAFGHAITLGALHRSRDWFKSQGSGKGTSIARDITRPIIRKPLHFVGRSLTSAKQIFNSLHHQISNKISVDPFGRSHPAHDFSVTAVQGKRDANLFTVITPDFEPVRAPTSIALIDSDRPLMLSRAHWPAAMSIKQQVVISHDAMNPVINALITQDTPYATIPVGAEIFNNCTDVSKHRRVVRFRRRPPSVRPRGLSICKSRDMAARYTKNRADNSYCSSPGSKGDRAIHFRALPYSTASLRISFSRVLRPKAPSNCLIRLSASTISEAGTTGSLTPTATRNHSEYTFFHWNSWVAARPAWRATIETVIPGSKVCFTNSSFCSGVHRLRRCTPVMTSIRLVLLNELISVLIGVFLLRILRNTRGTVNQGATSAIR